MLQSVPIEGTQLAAGRARLLARTFAEEIGLRTAAIPRLQLQLAVFRQDFSSEQRYDQDAGEDSPTAPSRREGVELSGEYRPFRWLELNVDGAFARARYFKGVGALPDGYGIAGGTFVALAPRCTGSAGILVDHLGRWSGGLTERVLGPYPLNDGPSSPHAHGYAETNLEVGYQLRPKLTLRMSIYNLFNSHAESAEYYYQTAITRGEVLAYGTEGVAGYQVHPLEPISLRVTLSAQF